MLKVVGFALVVVCASVKAEAQELKSSLPSITIVTGAEREVVPDIANLFLSVSTERKTASAAAEETARNSQSVLDAVRLGGVEARDLKTAVTVSPVFDEQRDAQRQLVGRILRGYVARNSITIRLRDTAKAGALARSLIDKGANVFEGIQFVVSEDERRMDELRVAATRDALRQAKLYAEAAGVRLGRVISIDPQPIENAAASLASRRATPARSEILETVIPVEPGVEKVFSRVSVTWEIVQQ